MKIVTCKQNSPEWFQARLGIPTASEFDSLVTPLWKPRTGEGVETYLARKLAEKWRGEPLVSFHGGAMEQGSLRENEGLGCYGTDVLDGTGTIWKTVGFVTTDDGKIGCSPDALVVKGVSGTVYQDGDEFVRGIEAKCPQADTHVKYLLAEAENPGEVPKDYRAQVQGSMLVTGSDVWTFLSYARGFPPLVLEVERDDKAQEVLANAIGEFNDRLEAAYATMVEINGGEPKRKPKTKEQPQWQTA